MSNNHQKSKSNSDAIRPIDHVVLSLPDLDIARQRYELLGFNVAPVAQHSFGTINSLVAFENGTFLEPLAIGDKQRTSKYRRKGNPFLIRDDSYRYRHGGNEFCGGFSMVALSGANAKKDRKHFRKAGLRTGKTAVVKRPGLKIRAVFALDERSPDCTFFVCERIDGAPVFDTSLTSHENGALRIERITLVDDQPEDFRRYLELVSRQKNIQHTEMGLNIKLPNGELSVLTPDGLKSEYGTELPHTRCREGLRQVTFDIAVKSLDDTAMALAQSGIEARQVGARIVVANAPGQGAMMAFVEGQPNESK